MPVSEIQAGMKGYGLSVFEGTTPERFDVEVIGVLHKFRPDQDLVLIKTPHPLLNHTGSVAGMSGSPIYLDGRLIGAYAYGWSYGKDPIAGVTPISNMLKELERPRRPDAFPDRAASAQDTTRRRAAETRLPRRRATRCVLVAQRAHAQAWRVQATRLTRSWSRVPRPSSWVASPRPWRACCANTSRPWDSRCSKPPLAPMRAATRAPPVTSMAGRSR